MREENDAVLNAEIEKRIKYANEVQQIADALGMPFAPFRNILERVKDLVMAESNSSK